MGTFHIVAGSDTFTDRTGRTWVKILDVRHGLRYFRADNARDGRLAIADRSGALPPYTAPTSRSMAMMRSASSGSSPAWASTARPRACRRIWST